MFFEDEIVECYNDTYHLYRGVYEELIKKNMGSAEKYYLMAIEKNYESAMCNLADLYEDQNKLELAEKYYLTAIEKDNKYAMNNLAFMYKKQNKIELAKKYYLIAANNHDTDAKIVINKILRKNTFDIDFAVKPSEHLDDNNLNMLNIIISYIDANTDPTFNMRLGINMICTRCKNTGNTVFLFCGHPICTKCFHPDILCSLCAK